MGYIHRWKRLLKKWAGSRVAGFIAGLGLALTPLLFLPLGCNQDVKVSSVSSQTPVVRVRVVQGAGQVTLSASEPPFYQTTSNPNRQKLGLGRNMPYPVTLSNNVWRVGSTNVGSGELTVTPSSSEEGSVRINSLAYRGSFRLVAAGPDKFDVINDVDIEGYLCGVLPAELLSNWHLEAYKAQAIVARTYALYHKQMSGSGQAWDLECDQRSQVYGGIAAESAESRAAVDKTRGVVVTYGPPGQERIFEAYFSSCCGGVTQSAADAFGKAYTEPLSAQNNNNLCNASPKFNWGPVTVRKDELARRFRKWGTRKDNPLKNLGVIVDVQISATNQYGRPTRFEITDGRQNRYSLCSEDFRSAVNTDNPNTIYSSFCKVITDADSIRFVEGHGFGHGVGMCQYCAEKRAELGMPAEDIVLAAYPKSKIIRIPE